MILAAKYAVMLCAVACVPVRGLHDDRHGRAFDDTDDTDILYHNRHSTFDGTAAACSAWPALLGQM